MELDEMILASEQQVAAEQSIVGCVLLDEKCLTEVRAAIRPEMFAINRNKEAFVAGKCEGVQCTGCEAFEECKLP